MKKILLSLGLFSLVLVGKSQTILNELYVEPSGGTKEFFELYYAGTLPIGDNVDCWTLVSYYDLGGTNKGVYVMDLPNVTTGFTNRYMVGASSNPFTAQGSTNKVPNFNWNAMPASGKVTKWRVNGGAWVQDPDPVGLLDFFNNKGGGGFNYSAMIFVNGAFNNGFLGGTSATTDPIITTLPALNLTTANSNVCANFTINWNTLGAMEQVNSAAGTDNGYNRTADGRCGAWEKSSSSSEHTPGSSNGPTGSATGSLITSELLRCNVSQSPFFSVLNFDITGLIGNASLVDDFPVDVQLFYDLPPLGVQGGNDIFQRTKQILNVTNPLDTFRINESAYTYLIYKTKRGCFDKVVFIPNGCISLPVSFKSFTATRSRSTVLVKWETSTEINNSGFDIERNINGTWEKVGFVASQATSGNSAADLSYQFIDLNNAKGITQYRIKQIDLDAKSKFSEVRSVRGDGQKGQTIIYPNPSNDGRVNIVFEERNVSRDISVNDMAGRTIKQMKGVTSNNITIDNLTPGMYSLRIVIPGTGEQTVEKIVVNKR
ncbi:MAG: T9SS type A sorting domain-containing protein [Bacteroidota bacterium]|nr:T9SS type A sorting domain-containing protein [Bacteroidota bacterium]